MSMARPPMMPHSQCLPVTLTLSPYSVAEEFFPRRVQQQATPPFESGYRSPVDECPPPFKGYDEDWSSYPSSDDQSSSFETFEIEPMPVYRFPADVAFVEALPAPTWPLASISQFEGYEGYELEQPCGHEVEQSVGYELEPYGGGY